MIEEKWIIKPKNSSITFVYFDEFSAKQKAKELKRHDIDADVELIVKDDINSYFLNVNDVWEL